MRLPVQLQRAMAAEAEAAREARAKVHCIFINSINLFGSHVKALIVILYNNML